jgi:RNA polymerase sigma-70 factor, ECF subfamily
MTTTTSGAQRLGRDDVERALQEHRRELTGYCYRMLGSGSEAEDAVQETLVRAWKAIDRFEGRSSVRSWLYRIATNVCVDMLRAPQRRARPMDLGPSSTVATAVLRPQPENTFVQPIADSRVISNDGDPAEVAAARESIRLAFVAALQHLPARQRAVLILCEVLRWQATEVAELLETSVASVNSALQRARATLGSLEVERLDTTVSPEHEALLARYVDAFERYDMTALAKLLRDDAVISMPPHDLWLQGADEVIGWMAGPGRPAPAPSSCPWRSTARPASRATSPRLTAGSPGPSRSSRSRRAGSPVTTTSCTPSCSPISGSRPTSTDGHPSSWSPRPARSTSSRSSSATSSIRTDQRRRRRRPPPSPAAPVYGVLGPNGAGKTTTIRHARHPALRPTATGWARVLGHDVVAEADEVRAAGEPHRSVGLGRRRAHRSREPRAARAAARLPPSGGQASGPPSCSTRSASATPPTGLVREYSGGMRRRSTSPPASS